MCIRDRWREGRGGTPAPPSVFLLSHALDDAGSCGASARLHLFHSIAQFPARQKAVEFPGSVRMAFDCDARGLVSEVNAVVGFIYFLAASPAAAEMCIRDSVRVGLVRQQDVGHCQVAFGNDGVFIHKGWTFGAAPVTYP